MKQGEREVVYVLNYSYTEQRSEVISYSHKGRLN